MTGDVGKLSPEAEAFMEGLPASQQALVKKLASLGQAHLFEHWGTSTEKDGRALASQLEALDKAYPDGGLEGYIKNARKLLESSRKGVNPLEGWTPSISERGQLFELGSTEFTETEELGMKELGRVGFVLVAGGLGERLGYSSIKLGLPTEMATQTCYLQYYIEYILAVQKRFGKGNKLPLCIMTSMDTNDRTVQLLEKNNYFGMDRSQVTLVQQGQGVPALTDNDAKMSLDPADPSKLVTKPHGHGDIHALLFSHQVTQSWQEKLGIKWFVLFQDTNGLAFHTLPLMLGVSSKLNLTMNSLAVPRKAKQAIGGIAQLTNKSTGQIRTINVEYNQLDPLLRATAEFKDGDVNDPKTGYSPFPGNINQLVFQLKPYNAALDRTRGIMPEFVNPKYKDEAKTIFKKPTRLECMMQDFPTVLESDEVGYTCATADLCFSPVKNATADGVKLQSAGTQAGTAATGEADQYGAVRKMMRAVGCNVPDAETEMYLGISVVPGPAVVLKADFCSCPGDYKTKFPAPGKVKISQRSTLIVRGSGVVIESLDLEGTLVVDCRSDKEMVIRDLVVKNDGWVRVKDETSDNEIIKMRGYHIERKQEKRIEDHDDGCQVL